MGYSNYETRKSSSHQKEFLLPLFENSFTTFSTSYFTLSRSILRQREKYILILITLCFIIFCIGGFFFLPELKAGRQFAYKHFRNSNTQLIDDNKVYTIKEVKGRIYDALRFNEKVEKELNKQENFVLPKPAFNINRNIEHSKKKNEGFIPEPLPIGEDINPEIRNRRDVIKEMMLHAWNNYVEFAWGENELKPISRIGHSPGIFGTTKLGASIVDALDTLYIMGLKKEFEKGRKFVENNLSLDNINSDISVFEINIRFIGGLLSVYSMTGDKLFLNKAESFAQMILPVFDTKYGIPWAIINPSTGSVKNYQWTSGCSILAEFGTLHLEFVYLSHLTNNSIYREKVEKIRNYLEKIEKIDGLYPNYLNPLTGRWGQNHFSMGGLGDSFYEYLLKSWLQSNRNDAQAKEMYISSMNEVFKKLLKISSGGLMYLGNLVYGRIENKMEHLACFAGGLIALGGKTLFKDEDSKNHISIGANITNTCHESYIRSVTKLGPDSFYFHKGIEAKATKITEKLYILRPEVVESYFYLWRITKDPKYRDWAWNAAQAIQLYCRVDNGFSGIKNVYEEDGIKDDVQQSFFFAETLKYLYLIFSDDSLISFDKWVFNSEGHPLPIFQNNSAYRF